MPQAIETFLQKFDPADVTIEQRDGKTYILGLPILRPSPPHGWNGKPYGPERLEAAVANTAKRFEVDGKRAPVMPYHRFDANGQPVKRDMRDCMGFIDRVYYDPATQRLRSDIEAQPELAQGVASGKFPYFSSEIAPVTFLSSTGETIHGPSVIGLAAVDDPGVAGLDFRVVINSQEYPDLVAAADAVEQFAALPVNTQDMGRKWDSHGADARVRRWASSDGSGDLDKLDWAKYAKAFLWCDPDNADSVGGYKLPFADIVGGELTAIWRGVSAAYQRLDGTDIPEGDKDGVKAKLKSYYKAFDKPWPEDKEQLSAAACVEMLEDAACVDPAFARGDVEQLVGDLRGGVVAVTDLPAGYPQRLAVIAGKCGLQGVTAETLTQTPLAFAPPAIKQKEAPKMDASKHKELVEKVGKTIIGVSKGENGHGDLVAHLPALKAAHMELSKEDGQDCATETFAALIGTVETLAAATKPADPEPPLDPRVEQLLAAERARIEQLEADNKAKDARLAAQEKREHDRDVAAQVEGIVATLGADSVPPAGRKAVEILVDLAMSSDEKWAFGVETLQADGTKQVVPEVSALEAVALFVAACKPEIPQTSRSVRTAPTLDTFSATNPRLTKEQMAAKGMIPAPE